MKLFERIFGRGKLSTEQPSSPASGSVSREQAESMKLADFVSTAIAEIIDGVARAQEYAEGKGASVNPPNVNWSDKKKALYISAAPTQEDKNPLLTTIDFDVLVTAGRDKKAGGGFELGVAAAAVKVGVTGETRGYSEAANRLKFQVLVKLPQQVGDGF
jgi:hypothetical protein